jgi:hypothetical protein
MFYIRTNVKRNTGVNGYMPRCPTGLPFRLWLSLLVGLSSFIDRPGVSFNVSGVGRGRSKCCRVDLFTNASLSLGCSLLNIFGYLDGKPFAVKIKIIQVTIGKHQVKSIVQYIQGFFCSCGFSVI